MGRDVERRTQIMKLSAFRGSEILDKRLWDRVEAAQKIIASLEDDLREARRNAIWASRQSKLWRRAAIMYRGVVLGQFVVSEAENAIKDAQDADGDHAE